MEMFISFFTGKVMLFYGISLIMKEKSNASALATAGANNYYDGFPSPAFYFHKQLDKLQGGFLSVFVTWCGKVFAMPL